MTYRFAAVACTGPVGVSAPVRRYRPDVASMVVRAPLSLPELSAPVEWGETPTVRS
ncbi:hypothetical protein APS67_001232 [Streptomyces sp. AVP053U2]|nr:hypothetical protein APS67_001232 [Streptomyces sp. AVP053U2]